MTNQTRVITRLSQRDVKLWVTEAREKFNIPALSVIVSHSHGNLIEEIQGVRNINSDALAKLDDQFHIGSGTKSVLALVSAYLVEQGKINWESRFIDVLPEFKGIMHTAYLNMTLENLLSFRAGIATFSDWNSIGKIGHSIPDSTKAFIEYVISLAPATKVTEAGFEMEYSNASHILVTAMVEKVTGDNWQSLVKRTMSEVFNIQLDYGWPDSDDGQFVSGHVVVNKGIYGIWQKSQSGNAPRLRNKNSLMALDPRGPYKLPTPLSPAGDVNMTPLEYAKYAQLHLRGARGTSDKLPALQYKKIQQGQSPVAMGIVNYQSWGKVVLGYDGNAGSFYSHTFIIPADNLAFTILANNGSDLAAKGVQWLSAKLVKKQFGLWWAFWI